MIRKQSLVKGCHFISLSQEDKKEKAWKQIVLLVPQKSASLIMAVKIVVPGEPFFISPMTSTHKHTHTHTHTHTQISGLEVWIIYLKVTHFSSAEINLHWKSAQKCILLGVSKIYLVTWEMFFHLLKDHLEHYSIKHSLRNTDTAQTLNSLSSVIKLDLSVLILFIEAPLCSHPIYFYVLNSHDSMYHVLQITWS